MKVYTGTLLALCALFPQSHSSPLSYHRPPTVVGSFDEIRAAEAVQLCRGALVNATQAGAACPQPQQAVSSLPLFDNITSMSEDCLTLRIDRPASTPASAKLPVLVWIYGGGDTFGQIYDSTYDPTGLVTGAAQKGFPIIYIAMNYRVGIFGFADSPALAANDSQNVGLLDQRLALEWVQKHISAFGGDPERVTIAGESDGATAVGLQITAYGGRGHKAPFQRAIMESGSPMADTDTASNISAVHTAQLTQIVNCTASTSTAELQCLRALSMQQLNVAAVAYEDAVGGDSGMDVFIPTSPSSFIPDSPSKLLTTGQFARNIDILGGWNEDDGTFSTLSTIASSTDVALFLAASYPALSSAHIKKALDLYPVSDFSGLSSENISAQYFRASQMQRDAAFACPSLYMAQMNAQYATDLATTNYLFALNQTLFRTWYAAANASYLGVSHFSDIPYVFNQAQGSPRYAAYATAADRTLSSEISGSWAAFATFGSPSHGNGTITGWKGFTASPSSLSAATPGAESSHRSHVTNQDDDHYYMQVIGGPDSGIRQIGKNVTRGGYEELAARCAFWTSREIVEALQV
ncbi:carboxylesterase family protein [Aspergillus homomorphus CBS 101889]|uniref:Carboxylesterase family protein n=1 Tax=Aspergillus homomorphus (strain CBS 101889) TaxID=1450537 RepID=A0A395HY01_ASPHC|nr:carboxylesterase family protein [Aspergillus homomorphus CBS 101889]RAL12660.1 carboxylesterase family protein [Aspergillus homomorphus CBS 101889]